MKKGLQNLVRTFEALGPLVGHAVTSGQLFRPRCELTQANPDVLCEYDVKNATWRNNLDYSKMARER